MDNAYVDAEGDAVKERKSPVAELPVTRAASAKSVGVNEAVGAVASEFPAWSALGPGQRLTILNACADTLEARGDRFGRPDSRETGGIERWFGFSIMLAATVPREAAAMTTRIKRGIISANKSGGNAPPVVLDDADIPTAGDGAQMPFGGVKASGYGRFGGTAAIDEFSEPLWITIEDPKRRYLT